MLSGRFKKYNGGTINIAAASQLPILDAGGYFAATDAEAMGQEVGAQLAQHTTQLIEKTSYGVITGLGVTQQTVADMTVKVATGTIYMSNGDRWTPTANNSLVVTAADATNPRIDIVYVDAYGVIKYLAGTAAATPSAPTVPTGGQKIAQIFVSAGKTSIVATDISDYRKNMWNEAYISPTLLNSWTQYGSQYIGYYKDVAGVVRFKGRIAPGSFGVGCMVLPSGYRPPHTLALVLPDGGGLMRTVTIGTDGTVSVYTATTTYLSFDGLSFRAI